MHLKVWNETFENSPVLNDEKFKRKSREDVLSDTNKLQLKIIDKLTQGNLVEVSLMKVDTETPELGIQLLRKYHSQRIGTSDIKEG